MKHNLRFLLLLVKLKMQHMTVFRLSFFGSSLNDAVMFLIQMLTFNIIYGTVDGIGDWSRGQMVIFIGTFSMLNALSLVLTYFGLSTIPSKIRDGGLDHYLTKPVNPLLRLTFESIDFRFIPLLLYSLIVIVYGASIEGIVVTIASVVGYSVLVLLMSLLWYDLAMIIRIPAFFVLSTSAFDYLEDSIFTLVFKVPGTLFKGAFKIFFYFIMPYGIMSTVPTQYLTGTLSLPWLLQALGVVAVFTSFTLWFWRFGVKHYKSASS